jgi:hypothetical protein
MDDSSFPGRFILTWQIEADKLPHQKGPDPISALAGPGMENTPNLFDADNRAVHRIYYPFQELIDPSAVEISRDVSCVASFVSSLEKDPLILVIVTSTGFIYSTKSVDSYRAAPGCKSR